MSVNLYEGFFKLGDVLDVLENMPPFRYSEKVINKDRVYSGIDYHILYLRKESKPIPHNQPVRALDVID